MLEESCVVPRDTINDTIFSRQNLTEPWQFSHIQKVPIVRSWHMFYTYDSSSAHLFCKKQV